MRPTSWFRAATAVWVVALSASALSAQTSGCRPSIETDPPRTILRCDGGLTIETEAATQYRLHEGRSGRVEGIDVASRAVLVNKPPRRVGGFQVQTPHAIASVRGTVYAVDVGASGTAVFVVRGRVAVMDRSTAGSAKLGPGQGIDVGLGQPFEVKTWGSQRAKALLARFGR